MALLWYSTSIFGSWNSLWKTETADCSNGGRPACGVALRNSRHSRWCRGFPPGEDHFDLLKLLKGEPILSSSYIYIIIYIYIYKESSSSGSNIGFSKISSFQWGFFTFPYFILHEDNRLLYTSIHPMDPRWFICTFWGNFLEYDFWGVTLSTSSARI